MTAPRVRFVSDDDPDEVAGPNVQVERTPAFTPAFIRTLIESRRTARRDGPDVIHADGPNAIALAATEKQIAPVKVVASGASWATGWRIRSGLRAADRVVARTTAERQRYEALGVPADRITIVPPAVPAAVPALDGVAFRHSLDIRPNGRLVIAAGRFDTASAMKSAAWAFDALRYAVPDVYLVLVGDGPERRRVEEFTRAVTFDDYRVRFTTTPGVVSLADVVWVTDERGGVPVALEAMAAGRPVVAVASPDLAEVVGDAGRLVPPTDRVQFAAVTFELLDDSAALAALGDAGRRRAGRYPARAAADAFAELYRGLVGGGAG